MLLGTLLWMYPFHVHVDKDGTPWNHFFLMEMGLHFFFDWTKAWQSKQWLWAPQARAHAYDVIGRNSFVRMTGLACPVKTCPIKEIPMSQTDKRLFPWNDFPDVWLNKLSFLMLCRQTHSTVKRARSFFFSGIFGVMEILKTCFFRIIISISQHLHSSCHAVFVFNSADL